MEGAHGEVDGESAGRDGGMEMKRKEEESG